MNSLAGVSLDLHTLARLYQEGDIVLFQVLDDLQQAYGSHQGFSNLDLSKFRRKPCVHKGEALISRRAAGEKMPLYGVPFAVKDNIDVAGLPTTAGWP